MKVKDTTMKLILATLAALAAAPAIAQDAAVTAKALLLPMLQETAPGAPGEVLTDCIIASATPEELTTFAAAPGPSMEIGSLITAILIRPDATTCMTAAMQ